MKSQKISLEYIDGLMANVNIDVAQIPNTTTTLATVSLPNGFVLAHGESACISPVDFDSEIGAQMAIENAINAARSEIWKLEGYRKMMSVDLSSMDPTLEELIHQSPSGELRISRQGGSCADGESSTSIIAHMLDADGATLDFNVKGNLLSPLQAPPMEEEPAQG